ncbi:hypothetical protein ACFL6Y_09945 [Elusimicrobiota bacterium]
MTDLEKELIDFTKRRFSRQKNELLTVLNVKDKEIIELKELVHVLRAKISEIEETISQEHVERLDALHSHEQEMLRIKNDFEREREIFSSERKTADTIIDKLNATIQELKKYVKQLLDENSETAKMLNSEILKREEEIDGLRAKAKKLEENLIDAQKAAQNEKAALDQKINELEASLKSQKKEEDKRKEEARTAISKLMESLLQERSTLSIRDAKITMLESSIKKLEEEKTKIIASWETDRKKWEELWERERKVWERQKHTIEDLSDRSWKDRRKWETLIRSKEAGEARITKVFSGFLMEIGKMLTFVKSQSIQPHAQPPQEPFAYVSEAQVEEKPLEQEEPQESRKPSAITSGIKRAWSWCASRRLYIRIGAPALFVCIVLASSYVYWELTRYTTFAGKTFWELSVSTPSGIAPDPDDADHIWICDWKSGDLNKILRSDPSFVVETHKTNRLFFHPNSIAFDLKGMKLFTLDSVNHRILKHDAQDPSKIIEEIPTPTASSLHLSIMRIANTEFLAILDTVEKRIYLYNPLSLKETPLENLMLPKNISPIGLYCLNDMIWVYDSKAQVYFQFRAVTTNRLKRVAEIKVKKGRMAPRISPSGFMFADEKMLILEEGEPGRLILAHREK